MFSDAACTAELNTTEVPALKHAHKTFTEAKKATCTEKGNRAYWHCEDCGLYFADKDGVYLKNTSDGNIQTLYLWKNHGIRVSKAETRRSRG